MRTYPWRTLGGIVLIALGVWWYVASHATTTYQFITVTRGPIVETVSVTGSTAPVESVALGFQSGGTIARTYYAVGDRVTAGTVLAELNTATLQAALAQAQASYDSAVAARGATSLPETGTAARNTYRAVFTKLDTTLHDNVDLFFGQATAYGPELLINAPGYSWGEFATERDGIADAMEQYRRSLATADVADVPTLLDQASVVGQRISTFLTKLSVAANDTESGATAAQRAALTTARTAIDTALAQLSTARTTYRSGSADATSLSDASVSQAAAGVALARANLANARIVAPISGVITQFDAKVGQAASPSAPLIGIISENAYEISAGVPESDIGKVVVGNPVTMDFDAFPGETFTGKVFYIDPAETVSQGVVDYKIKVSLDRADARMKSGLTANLDIETKRKDSVLLLPQYAVLENDSGTYVKVLEGKQSVEKPITLGIQDIAGMVEILSGVTEGEQVLNIGLKQ